ncbi:MAG TPA: hypothetical protein VEY13_11900 [Rubrobacteraceae bacterium]|nr:hypothetical protein [Rubrobacteraceae bacterium]
MGRRPKGEGSIVKRADGRWQGAYQDNGKRRYVYGKTRKEAAEKLRKAIWNVDSGKLEDSNKTLGAYLSDWLYTTKNTLRVSTFKRYEQIVCVHLIPGLGERSEKKGFGKDVAALIRAKNDYKHDRGPVILEDIVEASQVVQETLKRCMEALAFLTDYAIRQVEDVKVSPRRDEFLLKCLRYTGDHPSFPQEDVVFHRGLTERDLYLDLGRQNWVPLYPFIATLNCSHCKVKETYFIDMWDQRRGTARMKSFERGHTRSDSQISDALAT